MPTQQEYDRCRALRHSWEVISSVDVVDVLHEFSKELRLRCLVCTGERVDLLDDLGDLVSREYHPAEGYRLRPDEKRATLQELRLRLIKRNQSR